MTPKKNIHIKANAIHMIENLDDLTFKQKEDLQKFVNIAHENKKLWWANGDILKGGSKTLPLSYYFSYRIDILNEILINFPITDKDMNGKEIKRVLQLISENEIWGGYAIPQLNQVGYCFRFKKQDTLIDNDKINIEDIRELNTQELLDTLQKILKKLKDEDSFEHITHHNFK